MILGVRIDTVARDDLKRRLALLLDEPRGHHIVTANPEIVLRAHRDPTYRAVVNAAYLVVADGFGLVLAGLLQGRGVDRITGVEILRELVTIAQDRGLSVHFALRPDGLSTLDDVRRTFPGLGVGERDVEIVIANHGAPLQDYWIMQHRNDFPRARIFVGVGGALDYLTGRIRRAPALVRDLGLEWLWRLIRQPRRARRIFRAVVEFPIVVLFNFFRS